MPFAGVGVPAEGGARPGQWTRAEGRLGLPGQEIMFLADIEVRFCFYENYSDELSDSVGVAINGKTGI